MEVSGWIAVIDDDPSVLMALTRALRVHGLQTRTYGSAKEFVAGMSGGLPACLIVDLQMPDMTGLDLLQYLQQQETHIPSIVITAHGDPSMREHCEAAGAIAFLTKPWRNASLLAAIDDATKTRSQD
jgi:FixJ family two-component response regulator